MEYQIIGQVTGVLLLIAKLNPNDTFYISQDDECLETYNLPKGINNGKHYIYDNIQFLYPDKHCDAILVDSDSLSIDEVDKLNEYLEKDEPAWLSTLYCEELKQLLEYEPFLGNDQCNIPKEQVKNSNKIKVISSPYAIISTFIDRLLENKEAIIVTLGNYQHFIKNNRIFVYNPTGDKTEDLKNLNALLNSAETVYFVPELINDEYYSKLEKELKFDNEIYLNTIKEGSKFLLNNIICLTDLWVGQKSIIRLQKDQNSNEEIKKAYESLDIKEYFNPFEKSTVLRSEVYNSYVNKLPSFDLIAALKAAIADLQNRLLDGDLFKEMYPNVDFSKINPKGLGNEFKQ